MYNAPISLDGFRISLDDRLIVNKMRKGKGLPIVRETNWVNFVKAKQVRVVKTRQAIVNKLMRN